MDSAEEPALWAGEGGGWLRRLRWREIALLHSAGRDPGSRVTGEHQERCAVWSELWANGRHKALSAWGQWQVEVISPGTDYLGPVRVCISLHKDHHSHMQLARAFLQD